MTKGKYIQELNKKEKAGSPSLRRKGGRSLCGGGGAFLSLYLGGGGRR